MRKNKIKIYTFLLITALGSSIIGGSVLAANNTIKYGRSSYSEEEWSKLMDNNLEYSEIEDLVNNFNPSIASAWTSYTANITDLDYSIKDLEIARRELRLLSDNSKEEYDFTNVYLYTAQANALSKVIESMDKAKTSLSKISSTNRPIRQAAMQLTNGVKLMFISYDSLLKSEELLNEQLKLYESMKTAAKAAESSGMSTSAEYTKAQLQADEVKNNLDSLVAGKESLRKSLIMLCGWSEQDNPNIVPITDVDLSKIDTFNPDEDIKKAIGNNFTLIEFRNTKYKKSLGMKESRALSEEQMEANLKTNLNSLYADVQSKKSDYEAAKLSLETADINFLGQAKKVRITKDNTVIVDGLGEKDEIQARIGQIKNSIAETTSDYDREKLQERLAKLSGGVAVIKVGAATETEMKERKLRIEDALNATKAAVEEGIVPGGGTILIQIAKAIEDFKLEGEEGLGVEIVKRALSAPLRQIVINAGIDAGVVIEKVKNSENGIGFDAAKEEYVDMVKAGIIDPAKVTRSAIQNAVSVSSVLLTTEVAVGNEKEESPAGGMPGGMGMPGMM